MLNKTSFYDESHTLFGHTDSKIIQWLFSLDHKRIGIMYLITTLSFFTIGALVGLLLRIHLMFPGKYLFTPEIYNQAFTLHGVIMIFLFIIPAVPGGLGNFLLPLVIGARDVSFPKLNLLSFWMYIAGAVIAVFTIFYGQGFPDTGWTFYAPYSLNTGTNVVILLFAAFLIGMSSVFTGINFITTVHRLKAPGMGFYKLPLFAWGVYSASWVQVLATPIVGITLVLVIIDRVLDVGIFDPVRGGDPYLMEQLFWIYSHPAVYIMILPAFGIVSDIVATFSRKTIFGYKAIANSSILIAVIGSLVWGHHLYTTSISNGAAILFSFLTFIVAIPSGIKFFNWLATMYKGSIVMRIPMIWIFGSFFTFMFGGVTGVILAAVGLDRYFHDTYFVVSHFHYTMLGGVAFMLFGGLYYWLPKMSGRMPKEGFAKVAFWFTFLGMNILWFPMMVAGALGMPRRYYDYLPDFAPYNLVSSIGAIIFIIGIIFMWINIISSIKSGKEAGNNPWKSSSLEWEIQSPPILDNFKEIPYVENGPHQYYKGEPISMIKPSTEVGGH